LKTDNKELYEYTLKTLAYNNLETIFSTDNLYSERNDKILSIKTHYEKIFLAAGMRISYLSFRLEKNKIVEDATFIAKIG
jgi:tRNA (guanine-N7-)-methyltransferase